MKTVFLSSILLLHGAMVFAQNESTTRPVRSGFLPYAQKWFEAEGGFAWSINESTSSLPNQSYVFSPPPGGNWFWGLKFGATWARTHRVSIGIEHLWHNYQLDWGSDRSGGSSNGVAAYHGLALGYGYNVLAKKTRFWWGPTAQLGLALFSKDSRSDNDEFHSYLRPNAQTGQLESTNYWLRFQHRSHVVPFVSLGMKVHYKILPERFSVGLSIKLLTAFTPRVITYEVQQVTPQDGPLTWEIYDGLTNVNASLQLRYWLP